MRKKSSLTSVLVVFAVLCAVALPVLFRYVLWSGDFSVAQQWPVLLLHLLFLLGASFMIRGILFDLFLMKMGGAFKEMVPVSAEKELFKYIALFLCVFMYGMSFTGENDYLVFSTIMACTQAAFHSEKIIFDRYNAWYIDDYSIMLRPIKGYKEINDTTMILYLDGQDDKCLQFRRTRHTMQQSLISKLKQHQVPKRVI